MQDINVLPRPLALAAWCSVIRLLSSCGYLINSRHSYTASILFYHSKVPFEIVILLFSPLFGSSFTTLTLCCSYNVFTNCYLCYNNYIHANEHKYQPYGDSIISKNLNGIHETVKYKENSNVKLFINVEAEDYPIHWHTPMEIIMPLEGGYTVQIGDDLVHLNESDIIFIASGVKHRLIAPDAGKRLILQIEWSAVSKIKELNSILTLIAPAITLTPETSGDIHSNIRKLLLDISDEYQTDSFLSEAVIYSKMLEVICPYWKTSYCQQLSF